MPLYHGSKKIEDLYIGSTKIGELYHGSTLVYKSSVSDTPYLKKPNYSSYQDLSNDTIYNTLDGDIWLSVKYNVGNNPAVYVSKNSDMSNSVKVVYATYVGGYTSSKGGCIIPIPKGYYFRVNNSGGARRINTVSGVGLILYKYRNKVAKLPNYTTGMSLAQNTVVSASTKPRWLYSYGNTRKVEVSLDNSNWITIAEGVVSLTVEPSAMFYIPAGYYFKTTGTENTVFECME